MTDLPGLIARREELDRQIAAAQQDTADEFNDRLAGLEDALLAYLATTGLPFYQRERKAVAIVSTDERVSAEFGYRRGGYGGFLAVKYPGGQFEFRDGLPPAAALIGLMRGLLPFKDGERLP
jgi:hypothetical protein